MMDTFASLVLASELPQNDVRDNKGKIDCQLLLRTQPFEKNKDSLFNSLMILKVIASTVYQQIILYLIYYNGSVWM